MTGSPGRVTVTEDSLRVVFHRTLAAPIDQVWAALTTPERLAHWFAQATVDLRVGGTLRLRWIGSEETVMQITVCDPPRSIAWQWHLDGRTTLVRFDLATAGDGCALTLTHSGLSPRAGRGAGVRAGWHAHLDGIEDAIRDSPTPWAVKTRRQNAVADLYPSLPD